MTLNCLNVPLLFSIMYGRMYSVFCTMTTIHGTNYGPVGQSFSTYELANDWIEANKNHHDWTDNCECYFEIEEEYPEDIYNCY